MERQITVLRTTALEWKDKAQSVAKENETLHTTIKTMGSERAALHAQLGEVEDAMACADSTVAKTR